MILTVWGSYLGETDHVVRFQIFNYDTTSWTYISSSDTDMPTTTQNTRYQFNLPTDTGSYISVGELIIKVIHETAGNRGNLLRIDQLRIDAGSSSSSSMSSSSSSRSSSSSSSSSTSFSSSSRSLAFP